MKVAYFDCFAGVSGDMILGALIDAGVDIRKLELDLKKLKVCGYKLKAEKTARGGISGTKFSVDIIEQNTKRKLKDIIQIIDQSDLDEDIKNPSKRTFEELAKVEAEIHSEHIEKVYFHEVGGLDSIIDVVGSFIGIRQLGIEAVYSSRIHTGRGFLECRHGVLPVPAPATLSLLKGIPIYSKGIEAELVTPTGICILKNVSRGFGIMPEMKLAKIGYGAGNRELPIPNLLRVYIGETAESEHEQDEVILIETNIDNMNPEVLAHVSEILLNQGALDVFMTPIVMKKNRLGTMFSVLTSPDKLDEALSTIFTETSTLGVRIQRLERKKLSREIVSLQTRFGEIKVKVGRRGEQIKSIAPEYETCKEIAAKQRIPLKDVYYEAKQVAQKALFGEKKVVWEK